MMKHKKVYFGYFRYGEQDVILCEICGGKAVDIHHIDQNRENNKIENLIAVCRECHDHAHSHKTYYRRSFFQHKHNKFLKN
jgi:5-methylcytosine-specific restriction endonuclease McrA